MIPPLDLDAIRARDTERIDCEMAAAKVERVRDKLDEVISGTGHALLHPLRVKLINIDAMLKRLKSDLGFPKAGL